MPSDFIHPQDFGSHFLKGDFERIYQQTTKEFQHMISYTQFRELATSFNEGVTLYQMEFSSFIQQTTNYLWVDEQQEKAIHISFNENGEIDSLYLKPYVTYPESDQHYTKNRYSLPFRGQWFVFWGGTNEFVNYHYAYASQRYAYDFVQMKNGSTFEGTSLRNENFHAFNQEILAPASGRVVKVGDGTKDNIPGEMDADNPAGNYVIIQHAHNEYSMLAHLKKHSIKVHEGDSVTAGQLIGRCGNSGNSSEPHLHFQVMDSPDFVKCKSIRIRFEDGTEPVQGDVVTNYAPPLKTSSKQKMDIVDKVEATLTFSDILLFIPRLVWQFFKN